MPDRRALQDFASILTDYKLTQKLAAEREASCLPRQPPAASPGTRSAAAAAAATDLEAQAPSQAGGEEGYERRALLQATQQRDSSRLDGAIAYNEALIEERDVGIADIQRQIAEVGAVGVGVGPVAVRGGVVLPPFVAQVAGCPRGCAGCPKPWLVWSVGSVMLAANDLGWPWLVSGLCGCHL